MASYVDERGDRVSTAQTNRKVDVTGVEARQGLLGRPVLRVLIGGLFLAVIAWAGVEIFGESTDNDATTQMQQATPPAGNVTPENQGTVNNAPANGEQVQPAPADRDPTPATGSGG